jgi:hypothetical protein
VDKSSIQARLDLSLLLRGPKGVRVPMQGLLPSRVTIDRNSPAVPDTAKFATHSEAFPFDPDTLEGAHLGAWLFEHGEPSLCRVGEPGFFAGVVEDYEIDRNAGRLSLNATDFTYFPAKQDLDADAFDRMDLSRVTTLEGLVASMLVLMPGGGDWSVRSIGDVGARDITRQFTRGSYVPTGKAPGGKVVSKYVTKTHVAALLGANKTNLWSAISRVCALTNVIPEVSVTADGAVVNLIDSMAFQTSSDLHPFERDGRKWREFTEGVTCEIKNEARQLVTTSGKGSQIPDFVEVAAWSPHGERISARWPPEWQDDANAKRLLRGAAASNAHGFYLTAHGAVSQEVCLELARSAYVDARRRRSTMVIVVNQPWSDGGGPLDPDVLDIFSGGAVMVHRRPRRSTADRLASLNLPQWAIDELVAAEADAAQNDLWQIDTASLAFSASGSFSATLGLRRFLARQTAPAADVSLDLLDARNFTGRTKRLTRRAK